MQTDTSAHHFLGSFWSHDPHSPGRAALYSAVIPGLGQAYNGKYWKIPIVYAGLGTSVYFIFYWKSFYTDLKNAYIFRTDDDSTTVDMQYNYITSDATLLQYVDLTRKYTDLMVVVTSFVYILNIIDAVVDAHLYNFDVSDDLSMRVSPYVIPRGFNLNPGYQYGVSLKFSLK